MPRPANLPTWATSGAAAITEPTTGKQAQGWVVGEAPPAQYFNWWQRKAHDWIQWLDGEIGAGLVTVARTWTALQTFGAGLTVPGGQTADFNGPVTLGGAVAFAAGQTATFNGTLAAAGALNSSVGASVSGAPLVANGGAGDTDPAFESTAVPTTRKLVFRFSVGATNKCRIYATSDSRLEITLNAAWDGTQWARDINPGVSSKLTTRG